jgi:hypothetical protein
MRAIAFVFGIILVITLIAGTVSEAETTPIYPGMGGAPGEVLTNMYPTVKSNTAIMEYIGECGVGTWHEEQMNTDFKSIHLQPANSCGKQLVFSARKAAGRDDRTRIKDIWIIGTNETWSDSMSPVNAPLAPGFVMPGAVIAIAICAALVAMIQRTR